MWQGVLLLGMVTGFGVTVYQLQRVNRFRQVDADLEARVTALSRAVREVYRDDGPFGMGRGGPGPGVRSAAPPNGGEAGARRRPPPGPPPDDRPPPPWVRGPRQTDGPSGTVPLSSETAALFGPGAGGHYFTIWYRDGSVLNRSPDAPQDSPAPGRSERDTLPHFRSRGPFREAVHCSGLGDCAMAGRSIGVDLAASRALGWMLAGAGAAVLGLGFAVGWWSIGRAIRPLEQIGAAAGAVARGNLSTRITVADPNDELGGLAAVLNTTFARLEAAFARQRQFTSDAAHELRTPLAIMISEAQTTLARTRSAAEYRETIEGGLEIAQQMRTLTETLLGLARFDDEEGTVPRAEVDLAEIAAHAIVRLAPMAVAHKVAFQSDLAPTAGFVVPGRLDLVVVNLLTNAIVYNRPGGTVRVATRTRPGIAQLTVSDDGVGILPEDLPQIFNRFYRADKARSRSEGHLGLGLAICKTILEAERGSIEVVSTSQHGTTFEVRIPSRDTSDCDAGSPRTIAV